MCAPSSPDYVGAAQAQGTANQAAARTQGMMNNPNVSGPRGSQTVTFGNFDQSGFDQAMQRYNTTHSGVPSTYQEWAAGPGASMVNDESGGASQYRDYLNNFQTNARGPAPTREQFTTGNVDQPNITQTLSPQEQQIFDAQQQARLGLSNVASQGVSNVGNVLGQPFNFSNYLRTGNFGNSFGNSSQPGMRTGAPVQPPPAQDSSKGYGTQAPPQMNADGSYRRMPMSPSAPSMNTPQGQQAEALGGLYGPMDQNQGQNQTQGQSCIPQQQIDTSGVAKMPVNAGMTGQNAIMSRLQPQIAMERQQLETQLRNQGLAPGGEAYNNAMRLQSQKENDLLSQAAQQGIGMDMSANAQGFGQAQAQGQFGNTAMAQALQQALTQRELPLNEATALMSGSQVGLPQYQPYQGANVQAGNISGAVQNQGNANMAAYNSNMQGLYGLGSSALMYGMLSASDRKLKRNIKRIGTHKSGVGVYEYDIFNRHEIGVMADEVEKVIPEAVMIHPLGFKMVNYAYLTV